MTVSVPEPDDPTPAEELTELLEVLVEAFGLRSRVVVVEADDELVGSVEGEDAALLVGREARTIEAIQHLAQRIVLRGGSGPRVVVDAGGYRAEHETELRKRADAAASSALSTAGEAALPAMPAADRRFVHEYLRERGDVETHSEGQEPNRRLVVSPLRP